MAKLTREQKIEIYIKYKNGKLKSDLSYEYNVRKDNLYYLIKLIDQHGFDILRKNVNKYYSPILKKEIIDKVLIERQSVTSTSLEFGLTSNGMLFNWIKDYKQNNYDIVEKRKEEDLLCQLKNQRKSMKK